MFSRNRQSQGLGLPTAGSTQSKRAFFAAKSDDGSARSIHLQNPIVKQWNRSSRERKITYIVMVTCFFSMIFGWRWLMYYNAYLKVDCNSTDCFLKFASPGRYKKISIEIPRHQLTASAAIKVSSSGEVKEDKVNMNEEWRSIQKKSNGKKGKKNSAINSHRGPDENGNYLSYALIFKDKTSFVKTKNAEDDEIKAEKLSDLESNEKDLSALVCKFGDRLENGDIRINMRQFGCTQTHRRVRNMTSKMDSYIAKRRQKLSIRESAPANWQAILLVVLGLIGFLLSLLIGLFWDENDEHHKKKEGGPGTRRRSEGKRDENPYGRQTPSRYEVNTAPIQTRARTSATTTRRR